MIEIKTIQDSRGKKSFLSLPWQIYTGDPYWVPPFLPDVEFLLNTHKNPFYEHAKIELFLAYKDRKPVGRIAAIIDKNYNDYHQEKTGWFGFFETINNSETVKALLDAVRNWLAKQGMKIMRGPVNPSTNETCGLLVEGFDDPPTFMMAYNPPYYQILLEEYGLEKVKDLLAYEMPLPFAYKPLKRLEKIAIRINNRYPHLTVRNINMKYLNEELARIKEVYNSAWAPNWGFVPMTDKEIDIMANRLKPLVVPELVWLAEWKDHPIAFLFFIPDYFQVLKHLKNGRLFPLGWLKFLIYRRRINRIRAITLGVKKEFHHTGVIPLLLYEAGKALTQFPYTRLEFSWILEDNLPVIRLTEFTPSKLTKRYRIYETKI